MFVASVLLRIEVMLCLVAFVLLRVDVAFRVGQELDWLQSGVKQAQMSCPVSRLRLPGWGALAPKRSQTASARWQRTVRRSVVLTPHALVLPFEVYPQKAVDDAQRLAPSVVAQCLCAGLLLEKPQSAARRATRKPRAKAPQPNKAFTR